jgi:hypothetical protein
MSLPHDLGSHFPIGFYLPHQMSKNKYYMRLLIRHHYKRFHLDQLKHQQLTNNILS